MRPRQGSSIAVLVAFLSFLAVGPFGCSFGGDGALSDFGARCAADTECQSGVCGVGGTCGECRVSGQCAPGRFCDVAAERCIARFEGVRNRVRANGTTAINREGTKHISMIGGLFIESRAAPQ